MRKSVTRTWLSMCAALYAAGTGCSTSSPNNLPPIEASGTPGAGCRLGNACQQDGSYCVGSGQACKYFECLGGSWRCPPDGGATDGSATFEAGADAGAATDAADAADAPGAADANDAAGESGNGDASAD